MAPTRGRGTNTLRGRGTGRGRGRARGGSKGNSSSIISHRDRFQSTRIESSSESDGSSEARSEVKKPMPEHISDADSSDDEIESNRVKPYNALLQSLNQTYHARQPPRKKRRTEETVISNGEPNDLERTTNLDVDYAAESEEEAPGNADEEINEVGQEQDVDMDSDNEDRKFKTEGIDHRLIALRV